MTYRGQSVTQRETDLTHSDNPIVAETAKDLLDAREAREVPPCLPVVDLDTIELDKGGHTGPEEGMCLLEAVAYFTGEPWSDHPQCVSPVIGAFGRTWNDSLSHKDRNRLLKPLIPLMIGTRTNADDDETRAWMATDWLSRTVAPAFLRLTPSFVPYAQALESSARIVDAATARAAQPNLDAATARAAQPNLDAATARAAQPNLDAALSAALSAARSAADSAALSAARSAADSAALSAARSAADSAADSALQPTVEALQASAVELIKAMCAVGREA